MIEAIIFDFGRVISAPKPAALFHRYEAELGLAPDTINPIMFDAPDWQRALVGAIDMDTYWRTIGPALNLHTPAECAAFQARYYADEQLNPGILPLIDQLKQHYTLAILSNHPHGLRDWLDDWGLTPRFDEIYCSGDEGVAKPDARAFLKTLERLGVSPQQALFIDDTEGHVASARALGMPGVVFSTVEALTDALITHACLPSRPAHEL